MNPRIPSTLGLAVAGLLATATPAAADEAHFRWAAHLGAGPWFVPNRTGGASGIGVQLGAQLNELVGVYYSGTAATGFASGYGRGGVDASFGAWFYNSVMADLTLDRLVQIGLGPSVDTLAVGSGRATTSSANVAALAGTYFGVQTRLGVLFLRTGTRRRRQGTSCLASRSIRPSARTSSRARC